MFPCHKFASRKTPEEVQDWVNEHKQELLDALLKQLPEVLEEVKKLEDAKAVTPETMNLATVV